MHETTDFEVPESVISPMSDLVAIWYGACMEMNDRAISTRKGLGAARA